MKELLTRQGVLNEIVLIGKKISARCEPSYWSFEDHYRVDSEIKQREALRTLYKQIKTGANISTSIDLTLPKISGIDHNKLRLVLIAATTGFENVEPGKCGRVIKDDKIGFVNSDGRVSFNY